MSGINGQRAASPPSVHISWTSDEGEVARPSERPEPSTTTVPVHGWATKSKQASSPRKENLLVDELSLVLDETDLQSISQEYNLSTDFFKLIRCHGDLRADHFFEETDLIMVYEEQLKVRFQFPLNKFYRVVLKFHHICVAQVHPNSWRTLVAFRGLC